MLFVIHRMKMSPNFNTDMKKPCDGPAPPKVIYYKKKFEVTFIKASRVYVHLFRSSSK